MMPMSAMEVEDRVDLEGEGRCHGEVGWEGWGEKRRRKKRWLFIKISRATPDGTTPLRVAPRRTARLAEESRQSMRRDSALPGQLSCQRGRLVAPKHVVRPFSESRHEFWRDQKG